MEKWRAPQKLNANGWFVGNMYPGKWRVRYGNDRYLHSDLVARVSTFDPVTGEYTGYFKTREKAREAIREYYKKENTK